MSESKNDNANKTDNKWKKKPKKFFIWVEMPISKKKVKQNCCRCWLFSEMKAEGRRQNMGHLIHIRSRQLNRTNLVWSFFVFYFVNSLKALMLAPHFYTHSVSASIVVNLMITFYFLHFEKSSNEDALIWRSEISYTDRHRFINEPNL